MAGYSAFGRWLEEKMGPLDLNISGLASLVGVSHVSVSRWMHGESQPRPDNIRALSRALGVPIEDVYAALGRIPQNIEEPESLRTLMELATRLSPEDQELAAALLRQLVAQRESRAEQGTRSSEVG
jgi:transcriptional regulator with XRE-family HTH domain